MAALEPAVPIYSYLNEQDDVGSPCQGITRVTFTKTGKAEIKVLPHLLKLDHPENITVALQMFDSRQSGALVKLATLLEKFKAIDIWFSFKHSMTDADIRPVAEISNLQSLEVSQTEFNPKVTDVSLSHLNKLQCLRKLHFANTAISDAGLVHLKKLKSLEFLILLDSKITGQGFRHIKTLPIMFLVVGGNLRDEGLEGLKHFKKLKRLALISSPIEGPGLVHLAGLKELDSISLADTLIDEKSLVHLQSLPKLRTLTLHECKKITDAAVETLSQFKTLEALDLTGTEISTDGLRTLRKALPSTQIEGERTVP